MSAKIDRIGVYRGRVLEKAVGLTKKGYPQWIARLAADEKWVETEEELTHYGLEAPGWVDYSDNNESMVLYACLFKADCNPESSDECIPGENDIFWYEDIQHATGWDGSDFSGLDANADLAERVLFAVSESTYNDQPRLEITRLGHYDDPPTRELKSVDADKLNAMNKKLRVKKKVKPAKAPAAAKPASSPPKAKPKAQPKADEPSEAEQSFADSVEAEEGVSDLPATFSRGEAWQYLEDNSGLDPDPLAEAWLAAGEVVSEGRDEDDLTPEDWAAVVRNVLDGIVG